MKLSVALATYNEEENIDRCLKAVKDWADEIIIVDGSSEDRTVEIAKKYKAKIKITDNPPIFHINKQKAIDACQGEWILQLDADEEITPELAKEIKEIVKKGSHFNAFYLKRKNYFLGKWMKRGGMYPDAVIRFFKKGKAYLPCKSVHEQMEVEGEIGTFESKMNHYTSPTFSHYLVHANSYTSLTAKEMRKEKIKINFKNHFRYFMIKPIQIFFSLYFRHKGLLDGFPGLVWALFSGFHFPIAYIKLWELKKKK
jgi:glycosyltransferase involved in cell wall biosynthesis